MQKLYLSMVASPVPLKAIWVHGGQQEQVHALHNAPRSLICLSVVTQPLCQPKKQLPAQRDGRQSNRLPHASDQLTLYDSDWQRLLTILL